MKNLISLMFLSFTILVAQNTNELPAKIDPSAQAQADKQMKVQNKNVIKYVIEAYSKKLPQKVDEYTSFVKIASDNLTLIYTFEINTGSKSDKAVIKDDYKRMSKMVRYGICKSSKRFLESDIDITYIYQSKTTKNELFKFDVTLNDCKNIKI